MGLRRSVPVALPRSRRPGSLTPPHGGTVGRILARTSARGLHRVLWVMLALGLTGCSGIKFNNSTNVFKPLVGFKERSVWHDPSILRYKLESLAGYFITKSSTDSRYRRVRQVLPTDYRLQREQLPKDAYYHSLVNAEFATQGGTQIPLLSVAASLRADQMMEITITDTALVHIPEDQIPWNKLRRFVKANPLRPGAERYWVQAVMLTEVLSKTATTVASDAQVSGAAYQVDGNVFNSAETQERSPLLTMLLIDVDKALADTRDGREVSSVGATGQQVGIPGRVARVLELPLR